MKKVHTNKLKKVHTNKLKKVITTALEESIGKRTITISDNGKPRETSQVKEIRKKKRDRRKGLENADSNDKKKLLQECYKDNKKNSETLCKFFNAVIEDDCVPEAWKKGKIITIYKGKGEKGKCSNERGITINSNTGKLKES